MFAPVDFTVRALDPLTDSETVHRWVTRTRGSRLVDVERECMAVAASEHREAFLGLRDGTPAFLLERYDPRHSDELAGLYEPEPGDVGMRFLMPADDRPEHGCVRAVLTTIMEFLFADPAAARVVVAEDDVSDTAAQDLHELVGFEVVRETERPEAPEAGVLLSFCTRSQFEAAAIRFAVLERALAV
ncbi:GNAT family N-acetyltransferase [Streptomyces sp. NPDC059009]|uniref:GNAT family N-acetyltransferase n=1 Tax=Streptomyces sp. NPDC059009 TaxID=3346694 RepID=UPI0036D001C4